MTIVTTRPRKRPAKAAQAAETKVPRIVQHTPRGHAWKLPPPDPEAEARIAVFFERMGIKRRDGGWAPSVSPRSAFSLPSVPSRSKHTGGRDRHTPGSER
jgi:hypothetical protein